MGEAMWQIEKERIIPVIFDKAQRLCRVALGQGSLVYRVFYHLLAAIQLQRCHVVAMQDAIKLIETVVDRGPLQAAAEMPLAKQGSAVAQFFKRLGQGNFIPGNMNLVSWSGNIAYQVQADWISTRQ